MRSRHLLVLCTLLAGAARAQDLNVISGVEVKDEGTTVVVAVKGSKPPNFTTFSMADPPRFVIDLSESRFQGVAEDLKVDDGVITVVKNLSYGSGATSIARVMIAFSAEVDPPDVQTAGPDLLVRVAKPAAAAAAALAKEADQKSPPAAAAAAAQPTAAGAAGAAAQPVDPNAAAASAAEAEAERQARLAIEAELKKQAEAEAQAAAAEKARAEAEARAAAAAAPAPAEQKLTEAEPAPAGDERAAAAEAARLAREEAAAKAKADAQARADAAAAAKADAAAQREAAKVAKAEAAAAAKAESEAKRQAALQAKADAKARAAEEARARAETARVAREEAAAAKQAAAAAKAAALAERKAQAAAEAQARAEAKAAERAARLAGAASAAHLAEVGFKQLPGASRVFVRTSIPPHFTVTDVGENVVRVQLENTRATRRNDTRFLDTSFFSSPVAMITPSHQGSAYVVDIKLRQRVPYQQKLEGNVLAIDFERPLAPGDTAGGAPAAAGDEAGATGVIVAPEDEGATPASPEGAAVPNPAEAPKQ